MSPGLIVGKEKELRSQNELSKTSDRLSK